jgi:hypothetical protein
MQKFAATAAIAGLALVPAATQAKTVNVSPQACGGAGSGPCGLRPPLSETIYGTTSPPPQGTDFQIWGLAGRKGQRYSINLAYAGSPVAPGTRVRLKLDFYAVQLNLRPRPIFDRGIYLCVGNMSPKPCNVKVQVTSGDSASSSTGTRMVPGQPLTGRVPTTGPYAIDVTGLYNSAPLHYRLDLKIG